MIGRTKYSSLLHRLMVINNRNTFLKFLQGQIEGFITHAEDFVGKKDVNCLFRFQMFEAFVVQPLQKALKIEVIVLMDRY